MELKKNHRYNLEHKSPLFFAIGLVVALLCVTVAFEWRSQYDGIDLSVPQDHFEPPIDIPITQFSKPQPPKPEKVEYVKPTQVKDIVAVENDTEIQKVLEPSDDVDIEDISLDLPIPKDDPVVIHDIVESMPEFPGGIGAFYRFISENIDYPSREKSLGIDGKVFVQFVIDESGTLTDIEVIKGVSEGLDKEAVEVLRNSPKWNPGKQRGRPVKVRMILPITFHLNH